MTRAEERHQEHMGLLAEIAQSLATIAENTAPQAPEDDAEPTTVMDQLRALVGLDEDAEDDSEPQGDDEPAGETEGWDPRLVDRMMANLRGALGTQDPGAVLSRRAVHAVMDAIDAWPKHQDPEDITALVEHDPEWRAWFDGLTQRRWRMGPIASPAPAPDYWGPDSPHRHYQGPTAKRGALDTRVYPSRTVALVQQAIRKAQPEYRDGQDVTAAYELLDALSDAGAHLHEPTVPRAPRTDGTRPWTT